MCKHELTEEFKALINGVVDGSIEAIHREDEPEGWTEATLGQVKHFFYPWLSPEMVQSALDKPVVITQEIDGAFTWRRAVVDGHTTESIFSFYGNPYQKPVAFKYRSQVALDSLRKRLDRGML